MCLLIYYAEAREISTFDDRLTCHHSAYLGQRFEIHTPPT